VKIDKRIPEDPSENQQEDLRGSPRIPVKINKRILEDPSENQQ
jgi:hypothetical protein